MLKMLVPVLDSRMRPLTPCSPVKARLLLSSGKASAYRNKLGVFCIILHREVEPKTQKIIYGIDSGSKFHGISIISDRKTVLNGMIEAVDWVKKAVETRKTMRRARRFRNCWRRPARFNNRLSGRQFLPPSTKARWQELLRIVKELKRVIPITDIVVEDVKASAKKGKRKWNVNFSPLEVGKNWFYGELKKLCVNLHIRQGYETAKLRALYQLDKCKDKAKKTFESHAVDAWTLAASKTSAKKPDDRSLNYWIPLRFHRRQLHRLQFSEGGIRKQYGSTRSLGLNRGTLVNHIKYGLTYVGGFNEENEKLSLHSIKTGKRLTQYASVSNLEIKTKIAFRNTLIKHKETSDIPPIAKANGFPAEFL
jgi:hypothetical protein